MKKRFTLFFFLFSFTISMSGQENTLSLDIKAGGLESAIDQEQWLKVYELTLTGSMNDADFYFIRDRLRTLKKLDMKNVQVDTIPVKALHKHENMNEVILPEEVKYIGDSALYTVGWRTVVTGKFPQLGVRSLGYVIVSEDNEYCKAVDDLICSLDGEILFFANDFFELVVPEGIEQIASRAFDGSYIFRITFPTTLKSIKENAFSNIEMNGITSYPYDDDNLFTFTSSTPPELQGNVFTDEVFSYFKLVVPNRGSVDAYKEANSQWSNFSYGRIYYGSHNSLMLDISAGGLENALSDWKYLELCELTLRGSMNDADFYFIRDYLRELQTLDIKDAKLDSIPAKALYGRFSLENVILPKEVEYVGDSAIYLDWSVTLTGKFPKIGVSSFRTLLVSSDNEYCKMMDKIICSMDSKILYFANPFYRSIEIPEGIEQIFSRAFDHAQFTSVTFPSTLRSIQENAFSNISRNTGSYPDISEYPFIFTSAAAPALDGNVFTDKVFSEFTLVVPDAKSAQTYKEADPQWSNFKKGMIYPENISSPLKSGLSVSRNANALLLKSGYCMNKIEVYNLSGVLLFSYSCNNSEVEIPNKYLEGAVILKITDQNGKTQTLKINR